MNSKVDIFKELDYHLLNDERPSEYLDKKMEEGIFKELYPFTMLSDLTKTEQSKKYHPEGSVWNHTLMVVDEAAKRKNESRQPGILMWSALLHDIGKAPTTKVRNGKVTSYNHEKLGRSMCKDFLRALSRDNDFIEKVSSMVRWHMEALFSAKDLPFSNIGEMLKEVEIDEIALLNLCDRLGRGDMSKEKAEDETKGIERFVAKCREYIKKQEKGQE